MNERREEVSACGDAAADSSGEVGIAEFNSVLVMLSMSLAKRLEQDTAEAGGIQKARCPQISMLHLNKRSARMEQSASMGNGGPVETRRRAFVL